MPDGQFPHLKLARITQANARLQGGRQPSETTKQNLKNRAGHSQALARQVNQIRNELQRQRSQRQGLPDLPDDVAFLLKVDPSLELESLYNSLGLEIVSEEEDGHIIVANSSIDFSFISEQISRFAQSVRGTGVVAQIFELEGIGGQSSRLSRVLDERLLSSWAQIDDTATYVVDVGIECAGKTKFPSTKPRGPHERDRRFENRHNRYLLKIASLRNELERLRLERESAIDHFIAGHRGTILSMIDADSELMPGLSDSFTARVRLTGHALRDMAQNFPFIFEIFLPDDLDQPIGEYAEQDDGLTVILEPPEPDAPKLCVIDSGIQEEHRYLAVAIDTRNSKSYLPGVAVNDRADYVRDGGHGTRVAGAALYGDSIPSGSFRAPHWLRNLRVLDQNNKLPIELFPPALLEQIVNENADESTKIFNHSINANVPCRTKHMSAWAASIDLLSHQNDILFVQSAGNVCFDYPGGQAGISHHLQGGRAYPDYLLEGSCRIANPAQSLQSLSVGSVASGAWETPDAISLSQRPGGVSGFSRVGPGIWGTVKPDVVEVGGDIAISKAQPAIEVQTEHVSLDLLRSNLYGGPLRSKDQAGTSFAAPKVARLLTQIQAILPNEPALLYRALIAQSARWPEWALNDHANAATYLKFFGYGKPSVRALDGSDHRVTLITSGATEIPGKEVHVYRVSIPESIRAVQNNQRILTEITLSFSAVPRRTRRNARRYLSTWVDWKCSRFYEPEDVFMARVSTDFGDDEGEHDDFNWTIGHRSNVGIVPDTRRNLGTLQKDWAICEAHLLPESFLVAVVAHEGWAQRPQHPAKYALAISFEALDQDIEIYAPIELMLNPLVVPAARNS